MTEEFDPSEARRLWRRAAPRPQDGQVAIDPLDLAAWIDGRADAGLTARVELALAADASLLETALAARAAAEAVEPAPDRLLVRARAMVAPAVAAPRPAGFFARLGAQFGPWQRRLEWAAIGVCFMIAASGGFFIGGGLGDNIAMADEPVEFALLGDDSTGLFGGEL